MNKNFSWLDRVPNSGNRLVDSVLVAIKREKIEKNQFHVILHFFDANSSLPNFFSTLFLVYVSFFSFRDEFYDILRELFVVGTKYEPKSPNCQIRDWRTSYTSLSKTWLALYGVGKLKHQ